jgi:hypothetical protein
MHTKFLDWKTSCKKKCGTHRHERENNIKIYVREIGFEDMN